jgi:TolB-like protein/DNA-binding winged helix-turn-helix (wHTH) protein/Tfp pilus assembly protein PilF
MFLRPFVQAPRERDRLSSFETTWAKVTMPNQPQVIRFGIFEVDLQAGEVRKSGLRQKLAGQHFQVLQVLLERPQEIVTREELRKCIWPGNTFVDYELALRKAVNRLREVLGDSAESPHFIETIPRRGYRFIGAITLPSSVPSEHVGPCFLSALSAVETAEHPVAAPRSRRDIPWKLVGGLALAGVATLSLWFNADKLRGRIFAKSRSLEIRSIAVLPLENLSRDPGQDYFSDGVTEALTTDLAQISALRVTSRTSAMHFKGSRETLPDIGRQLNVEAIVEGSVTRSGDQVRITAQLIDAKGDQHLWARTYERDLKDVLALQDEVARDIAAEIQVRLTPQEKVRLTSERKTSPRAYDAYLRGRYLWSQRNAEAIAKAVSYFQQAVREDPEFAAAYSGLSDSYCLGWGIKADLPLADEYARKAISLQPDLAEGHSSLGFVRFSEHRMADADKELRRALELNPNYAMAHHYYSGYLLGLGRPADALAENDRARQLDPFSLPINTMRGLILIGLRQFDKALDQFDRAAEIAPQSPFVHVWLARTYWLEGRALEAIAEEKQAGTLAHSAQQLRDQEEVAATDAKSGLRAARLKFAQLMERHYKGNYEAMWVAFQYGTIEDGPKVLQWLEEALGAQDNNLLLLAKTAPEFDFLRPDPRFQDLLRSAGLPQ